MEISLHKGSTEAVIQSRGAEITALRRGGREYIWNGGKEVWAYHAPILFPVVGRTLDGFYIWKGSRYELGIHGFIRDVEHSLVSSTDTEAVFSFSSTEETRKCFPWRFRFETRYELTDTALVFETAVVNEDESPLLFELGTHTAFTIDPERMHAGGYYIEFGTDAPLSEVSAEGGYIKADDKGKGPLLIPCAAQEGSRILLGPEGLGAGLILTGLKSKQVWLCGSEGRLAGLRTEGFPYLVLWQNAGEPRFVCIEPWYGLPDWEKSDHRFERRAGIQKLESGARFVCDQSILIG